MHRIHEQQVEPQQAVAALTPGLMAYTFTLAAAALMSYCEKSVFSSSCSESDGAG